MIKSANFLCISAILIGCNTYAQGIKAENSSAERPQHKLDGKSILPVLKNTSMKKVIQQLSKSIPMNFNKSIGKKGKGNVEE